jgi:acetolactate synthase regulatory subunit
MTHRVRLRIQNEPGALQRVLVFASKRGYEPVGLVARREAAAFLMDFEVESERPVATLVRTLEQLYGVEVLAMPPQGGGSACTTPRPRSPLERDGEEVLA